jgi:hypothetical protein
MFVPDYLIVWLRDILPIILSAQNLSAPFHRKLTVPLFKRGVPHSGTQKARIDHPMDDRRQHSY